jgi:hypothetical protein
LPAMKLPPAVSSYLFMPTVHFQERQNSLPSTE